MEDICREKKIIGMRSLEDGPVYIFSPVKRRKAAELVWSSVLLLDLWIKMIGSCWHPLSSLLSSKPKIILDKLFGWWMYGSRFSFFMAALLSYSQLAFFSSFFVSSSFPYHTVWFVVFSKIFWQSRCCIYIMLLLIRFSLLLFIMLRIFFPTNSFACSSMRYWKSKTPWVFLITYCKNSGRKVILTQILSPSLSH